MTVPIHLYTVAPASRLFFPSLFLAGANGVGSVSLLVYRGRINWMRRKSAVVALLLDAAALSCGLTLPVFVNSFGELI